MNSSSPNRGEEQGGRQRHGRYGRSHAPQVTRGRLTRNPYLNFLARYRIRNPHLVGPDVIRSGAEAWRNLSSAARQRYSEEARLVGKEAPETRGRPQRRPRTRPDPDESFRLPQPIPSLTDLPQTAGRTEGKRRAGKNRKLVQTQDVSAGRRRRERRAKPKAPMPPGTATLRYCPTEMAFYNPDYHQNYDVEGYRPPLDSMTMPSYPACHAPRRSYYLVGDTD